MTKTWFLAGGVLELVMIPVMLMTEGEDKGLITGVLLAGALSGGSTARVDPRGKLSECGVVMP